MCRTHAWTKLCGTFIECYWADRNCPPNHYDISSNFLLNVTLDYLRLMPDSFLHKIKYIVNVLRCLITCALTQFLLLLVNLCVLQCSPSYIGTTFWTPSMFFYFFFPVGCKRTMRLCVLSCWCIIHLCRYLSVLFFAASYTFHLELMFVCCY